MRKIYFDYASTAPVIPEAKKAMEPFLSKKFGNTMSIHSFGQDAKVALVESREKTASLIGAKPSEIVFTSSATESNNLALKGVAFANKGKRVVISSIEHPCVAESANWLESKGYKITRIKVDKKGRVDLKELEKAISKDTALVSIIHASNEIGTIQPIDKIGKLCKRKGVYFHTDASQSFGKIDIDIRNIDLLTASSHKICGPKGAALLYIKEGTRIDPILHGGGHENGMRPSTHNVPSITGFAKASEVSFKEMKEEDKRLSFLRDKIIKGVLKIRGANLNGDEKRRLPNNAHFWFSGIEGESLIMQLDLAGIAVSTGSACSSARLEPSHVLLSLGLKPEQAHGSLRISLGRWTKEEEIDHFLKVLPGIIKKLREISPFS